MLTRTLTILLFAIALCLPGSAIAMNRVQDLTGENPLSQNENFKQRDIRIGIGTFWWQILCGSSPTCPGGFSNLTILPVLGLNVAVGPTTANTVGSVYQLLPEETKPFGGYPSGIGTFLAADPTLVMLQGLTATNTASIGPLSPPGSSGQSVDYLIECNILTIDTTSQQINVVSATGAITATSGNRDRNDIVSCQSKAGVPAATGSEVTPTVDNGFVAIGYVAVPFGTSTINNGMIHGYTPLSTYVLLSPATAQTGAINVSGNITSGAAITGQTGAFNGSLTDGGEIASGDITTYRAGAPLTGSLIFGSGGLQYIYFDGNKFNVTGPIVAPSLIAGSLIAPPNTNLIIGAGSGGGGVMAGYNTGGTGGLGVYNGAGGFGLLSAAGGNFTGAVTAASLASSGAITGSSAGFTGPVTGTSGTFTNSLFSTNGNLFLNNAGTQSLRFDGSGMVLSAALNVPNLTTGTVTASNGNFSGTLSSAGLGVINGLGLSGAGITSATNNQLNIVSTAGGVLVNYGYGTGNGLSVFNGGTSLGGPLRAGAISGTSGTFTGGIVDTNGVLYLNAADTQYMFYDGTQTSFTSQVAAPAVSTSFLNLAGGSQITTSGAALILRGNGAGIFFQNGGGSANLGSVDNSGNMQMNGGITANSLWSNAVNGTVTLGSSGSNGFVNSGSGATALYMNFGGGAGGTAFCNGAAVCYAGISGTGAITGASLGIGGNAQINGVATVNNGINTTQINASNVAATGNLGANGQITAGGLMAARYMLSQANGTAQSYVPPVYTATGGAVGATAHSVLGTCTWNGSPDCAVTLSGQAVYTSINTWSCNVTSTVPGFDTATAGVSSGSNVVFHQTDNQAHTVTENYLCTGY